MFVNARIVSSVASWFGTRPATPSGKYGYFEAIVLNSRFTKYGVFMAVIDARG
ncbi:MAG: hypothetical protein KL863_03465 [Rhizobium sp.]|nr:hypothetical protein [Rhizobium sp.]